MTEFKNQECYDKNGKFIGWHSRSIAAVMATFARDIRGTVYVLASQRGKGTPDPEFVGAWNLCCGYLDGGETIKNAAIRETKEETGIQVPENVVRLMNFNDDPEADKRQNVTFRFVAFLPNFVEGYKFSHENNEKDEVDEIKWIPINDIANYKWAFGHDVLIGEMWEYMKKCMIYEHWT